MSITFNCSDCGSPLKVADTLAGRQCKCPKCAVVNTIPSKEDEEAAKPRTAIKKAGSTIAAGPAKSKKAPVAEEEMETLEEVNDEASDEKPKKGKGKKGKKGKSRMGLILGVVALLCFGLLFCAGGGGTIFGLWWFGAWPFGSGLKDEAKYFPANTDAVASLRVEDLLKSQLMKDLKADIGNAMWDKFETEFEGSLGIPLANVDRMVAAGATDSNNDFVVIVRTNKEVKSADILAAIKKQDATAEFVETKVKDGKLTINEQKAKSNPIGGAAGPVRSFHIVDSKMVVYGPASQLKSILERKETLVLSDGLKKAMKSANFNKQMAFAAVVKEGKGKGFLGGFGAPGLAGGKDDVKPEMVSGSVNLDKDIVASLTATFKDSADATKAKTDIDKGIADAKNNPFTKEFADMLDYKVNASGNDVTAELTVKGDGLKKAIRKFVK